MRKIPISRSENLKNIKQVGLDGWRKLQPEILYAFLSLRIMTILRICVSS